MTRTRLQEVRNARLLRSGRMTVTPIVQRSNARRIPLSRHLPSTLKRWSKGGNPRQSQQSANALEEILAESGIESPHHTGYLEADSDHMLTVHEGGNPDTLALNAGEMPSLDSEDVGLPPDGLWDNDAAYGQRFCYDHGQYEYLLGTRDRWMRLSDFDLPSIETKLEGLLKRQQDRPLTFDPHVRQCQAECRGNLFSHVHTVAEKRDQDGVTLYWIKWKTCWTPETAIDDKNWLPASLEVNSNPHRRRSPRQKDDLKEKEYHERVMLVKNVD